MPTRPERNEMATVLLVTFIAAVNLYALILIFARSWLFGRPVYRPMVLNLGLSLLPILLLGGTLVATVYVVRFESPEIVIAVAVLGGLAWLLMLPNSSYLITELNLNHRVKDDPTPLWFDIIAVLTLAMSGILNMVVSVLLTQIVLVAVRTDRAPHLAEADTWWLSVVVILLVALGMYMGRYLRFNSWDVLRPWRLVGKLVQHLRQPGAARDMALFTLTYGVFLCLIYGLIASQVIGVTVIEP